MFELRAQQLVLVLHWELRLLSLSPQSSVYEPAIPGVRDVSIHRRKIVRTVLSSDSTLDSVPEVVLMSLTMSSSEISFRLSAFTSTWKG